MNYEAMFLGVRVSEPHTHLDNDDQAMFNKYVADAFKQFREYVLSVATLINEKDVIYVGSR